MWIKPEIHKGGLTWYSVIQQNDHFDMVKQRRMMTLGIATNPNPFRIVLKTDPQLVVAEAPTQEEIQKNWDWIEEFLKTTAETNASHGKLSRDEMLNFLQIKFQSMTVGLLDSEEKRNQHDEEQRAKTDAALSETFLNTFNLKTEKLIATYTCSVWEKVPKTGTLYCSQNYVCFSSPILKKVIMTPYSEIKSIHKEKVKGVQTIKVATSTEQYWLVAFKLDEIFNLMEQLWDLAMKRVLKTAEQTMETIEAQYQQQKSGKEISKNDSGEYRVTRSTSSPSDIDVNKTTFLTSSKDQLSQKKKDKIYQTMFRLPPDECLLKEYNCKALKGQVYRKGKLFISPRFLCFESQVYASFKFFSFVIPMQDIEFITLGTDNPLLPAVDPDSTIKKLKGSINITVGVDEYSIAILNEELEVVYEEISQIQRESRIPKEKIVDPVSIWSSCIVEKISKELLANTNHFSPLYGEKEEKQLDEWKKYFAKYGNGINLVRSHKLRKLIREGVPNNLRGRLWMIGSGAYALLLSKGKGYYASLLERSSESAVKDDIEKDLHRSFPEHEFYQTQEGIDTLRRVLLAFSLHNPVIGYCQSMNIVCALLLLFLPEEHAFFLLCTICEQLTPDYYAKAMIGSIVDQRLFEELMNTRMPAVAKHLEKAGLPLPLITLPWFMCIFIGYVPLESALRILDCVFGLEGPPFLFSVALSLFKLNEEIILRERDGTLIASALKLSPFDSEQLLPMAFLESETLTAAKINDMRNAHRFKAIKEMETKTENTRMRELKKTTNFTPEELSSIYNRFNNVAIDYVANFEQFEELFMAECPWWEFSLEELFKYLDKKRSGFVDVTEYISIMSVLLKGSAEERMSFAFKLYDGDNDGNISKEEFECALNLLYKLGQKDHEDDLIRFDEEEPYLNDEEESYPLETKEEKHKVQAFDTDIVHSTFQECDENGDDRLSYDEFKEAVKQPLIALTLRL